MKQRMRLGSAVLCAMVYCAPGFLRAQALPSDPEFDDILAHDLADLTITSVSKRPQKLNTTAAAIYVVTREDIQRTGSSSVAEVLRVVPGLEVAQVASNKWAISARGFNGALANKLLVMIDGRSVYTPVFSGTYWDDRSLPVTEVERIEVIRGPGASVWGANAVNGIINIITKSGKDEQGDYISTAIGTEEASVTGGRGKEWKPGQYYRTYAQYSYNGATKNTAGGDSNDSWDRAQTGFRFDGTNKDGEGYMVSGQAYGGEQDNRQTMRLRNAPYSRTYDSEDNSYGGSLLGKWDHAFSDTSTGTLKASIDHYTRLEEIADQHVTTLDVDWQRDTQTSTRNKLTWGAGYRFFTVGIEGSFDARVTEEQANYNLFSAFLQDEYALVPESVFLTVGSKIEHNAFTGIEVQPSARISWVVDDKQTVWGAVSRAVRTPSIVDNDINLIYRTAPGPTYTVLFGSSEVQSEDLIAYELGYRVQATPRLQLDNTIFYNDYKDLTTYEAGTPYSTGLTLVNPFTTNNNGYGHVYGFESAATYTTSRTHKLIGSYSYAEMDLETKGASVLSLNPSESLLPKQMVAVRSYWNITPSITFDNMFYYVDNLGTSVDDYVRYDTRLAWQAMPALEVSLTGRNLFDNRHEEFTGTLTNAQTEIQRSLIGRATWRF